MIPDIPSSIRIPENLQPGDLFKYPTMGHYILLLSLRFIVFEPGKKVHVCVFYAFATNKVVEIDTWTVFNERYGELPIRIATI